MKHFTDLFVALDQTTKTTVKVKALVRFFEQASDQDKVWAIALFSHRRPRRTVTTTLLREWAAEKASIPLWLFEETYHVVGDLAETIAKVIPNKINVKAEYKDPVDLSGWIAYIMALKDEQEATKKEKILKAWEQLNMEERFLFNKLITGGFRVGVSQKLVTKALAKFADKEENTIAHRLMGNWDPADISFEELILSESASDDLSRPYPFYLAYALDGKPEDLGSTDDWVAEWKWDGIRGQLIRRKGEVFLWSRGEELVTDKYPEFDYLVSIDCPDFVIDGEILAYQEGMPLPFQQLQKRIGRKKVSKKTLKDIPVVLMAYDLLEYEGKDIRTKSYEERRKLLKGLLPEFVFPETKVVLSLQQDFGSWDELAKLREESRERRTEGFMLKKKTSDYKTGRKRGDWWKWKIDPMTVDAVMIYAMRGHGRRANLYTDFTFAVWKGEELVSFAKAYSGLTDDEFREVSQFVQKNTIDRFGPVRAVKPELVFELAFEGINESSRHKSGIALRFPRIKRWRKDKAAKEADTLEYLQNLLQE
jgi:DNA ligase-1